jgi:chemotaxis response regulator CheB
MRKIRILLVHHEALMRATLRLLLEAQPDIEVVSEASNRHAAIEKVYETTPDVSYST